MFSDEDLGGQPTAPAPKTKKLTGKQANPAAYGYPTDDLAALSAKVLEVTRRTTEKYGSAAWSTKDPLSMLVDIILSHRTRDEQTAEAYQNLLDKFGSWEAVRDAPTEEVIEQIANVNWPEVKAPRLQAIMRKITAERGELNLDFLRDVPLEEGIAWLDSLEGAGPKTIACVLLFSCRKPVLPVDTHVHRVSMRLGLIGEKVTPEAAHPLLQALLPRDARVIYNYHKGLLNHGKQICTYNRPLCQKCFLKDICDYYQHSQKTQKKTTATKS